MSEKSELRRSLTARRAAAYDALPDAGQRLVSHFPTLIEVAEGAAIAAYMPFRTEIDPIRLWRKLLTRGGQGALPRMSPTLPAFAETAEREALSFHLCDIDNPNHLQINPWGLLEPRADLPLATPNILLVPLLGFDRQGHRLGYGKGYYDRAIANLKSAAPIVTIGLAFAAQEVECIPTQPHDQRLDWIITEIGAYRCPS
jgi:5-formyltetrahydrofolate cyclo-ligase